MKKPPQLSRERDNSQACIFFYFVPFDHRRERLKRCSVAGVLDEPSSQLNPLSEVAVQARQST
jgi:hypothetical protein